MPTLFDNIRSRFTKSLRAGVAANTADIAATSWTVDMMTGLSNDYMTLARPYNQVSVVQAAIQAMKRNATKAVMQVGRWDEDGGFVPVYHPLQQLWQRPSPGESDATVLEHLYSSLCDNGNAYVQVITNTAGNAVTELMPIPSPWVLRPVMGESINEVLEYPVMGSDWGRSYNYSVPAELMLAFRQGRSTYAQSRGVSTLDSVVAEMALVKIIGQYETTVLSRSGVPSLIVSLKTLGNLSDAQLSQVQADLARAVSGKAVGRPFVGTSEMDIKSPGFSPKDLSVSEMADLATARICGVLGWAPMSLKQPDTGKTYSNLVEANKASWRDAVIPFLDLVAGELTRLVQTLPIACNGMTSQPDPELCVRFDTSQIEELSVDRKALMDIATAGVNAGIFSVNEARATLGLGEMEEPEEVEAVEPEEPSTDSSIDPEMEAE
jgi:HK97 family phage portal protein